MIVKRILGSFFSFRNITNNQLYQKMSQNAFFSKRFTEGVSYWLNSEIFKYTATSLLATVCDFSSYYALVYVLHVPALVALFIGQFIGSVITFILQFQWVFNFVDTHSYKKYAIKFFSGQIAAAIGNAIVVWFIITFFFMDAWLSRIITSITLWFLMFFINKFWVFSDDTLEK